jgi:hypothetical protein
METSLKANNSDLLMETLKNGNNGTAKGGIGYKQRALATT